MTDIDRITIDVCPRDGHKLNRLFDSKGCYGGTCPACETFWDTSQFEEKETQVISINLPDVTTKIAQ